NRDQLLSRGDFSGDRRVRVQRWIGLVGRSFPERSARVDPVQQHLCARDNVQFSVGMLERWLLFTVWLWCEWISDRALEWQLVVGCGFADNQWLLSLAQRGGMR